MTSLLSWLLGRQTAGFVEETDEIVPMYVLDGASNVRDGTIVCQFRFDDVLEPEKLHNALDYLLQMDGWRKLGGRFRRNAACKLEIHIPRPFSPERPGVLFTSSRQPVRMAEHLEASKMPQATGEPQIYSGITEYVSLGPGGRSPLSFNDRLKSDDPMLSVHVIIFEDGTLVSVYAPHACFDIKSVSCVMEAWSMVLAGKSAAVKPMANLHDDPLQQAVDGGRDSKYVLEGKVVSGLGFAAFLLRLAYEMFWSLKVENHFVCIPAATMTSMIAAARNDLMEAPQAPGGYEAPFISENDVLVGVTAKMVSMSQHPTSTRTVSILSSADARKWVKSAFRNDTVYIQNALALVLLLLPNNEVVKMPLGQLALRNRQAITSQLEEDQIIASWRMNFANIASTGAGALVGDSSMIMGIHATWAKAGLYEVVDFSPAIVGIGVNATEITNERPGKPVYYHGGVIGHALHGIHTNLLMGKDPQGNFWVNLDLPKTTWPACMEYLKSFTKS